MARLLRMPGISADAEEVVFLEWCTSVGNTVAVGDAIATVETEKANVDIEADDTAVLWRTLIEPGDSVAVGHPIAVLVDVGEEVADEGAVLDSLGLGSSAADTAPLQPEEPSSALPEESESAPLTASQSTSSTGRIFASPIARRLAKDKGVALEVVAGTGPGGRIVRADIERASVVPAAASRAAEPAQFPAVSSSGYSDTPHSSMRRAIARALTASKKQVPHFYVDATCRMDSLLALRRDVNESGSVKISINDFVLKAAAKALVDVPEMNVIWMDDCVRSFDTVDISVAIGSDAGLVTPVLRSVEALTVTQISAQVRDFSQRAKEGRLKQHELEGGSFSVSNLGMFGVEGFSAILNPPQAGILAVGAVQSAPVVVDDLVQVGQTMRVTLSVDHRPVDGVVAARWLQRFTTLVENPALMLV